MEEIQKKFAAYCKTHPNELILLILADNFSGRISGKGGATIYSFMLLSQLKEWLDEQAYPKKGTVCWVLDKVDTYKCIYIYEGNEKKQISNGNRFFS